jgi:hypothetical protein
MAAHGQARWSPGPAGNLTAGVTLRPIRSLRRLQARKKEHKAEMLEGALLAESLRVGMPLEAQLSVSKISRADVGDVSAGQPLT